MPYNRYSRVGVSQAVQRVQQSLLSMNSRQLLAMHGRDQLAISILELGNHSGISSFEPLRQDLLTTRGKLQCKQEGDWSLVQIH